MHSFIFIEFEPVRNPEYAFYKVIVKRKEIRNEDDIEIEKCFYDEFEASLTGLDRKDIKRLYTLMDRFSSHNLYRKDKFRQIEERKKERGDIFEFKKNKLRIYVCKDDDKKIIAVLYGGYKKNQEKDIERVFNIFKELKLPEQ